MAGMSVELRDDWKVDTLVYRKAARKADVLAAKKVAWTAAAWAVRTVVWSASKKGGIRRAECNVHLC